jgi:acyl-CoA synthetase (AMP-forming)/AMP-acid ligase II
VVAGAAIVTSPRTSTELAPKSLLDIARRRDRFDRSTAFLLTIDEAPPHEVAVLTYGEVLDRAAALADQLTECGVGRGDRVGCYLSNSPSWVVASLAVWMNGAAVAAAGTLLPGPEASRLFTLADAKVVIALADAPAPDVAATMVVVDEGGTFIDGRTSELGERSDGEDPSSDDLALAIFTSGTTGQPKGVTHTHHDLVAAARRVTGAYARSDDYRPEPAPEHLPPGIVFNPFGHLAGYGRLAFRMWIGRPTVIVPRFTVGAVSALLARFSMDTLQLTPTMIHMLATTGEALDLSGVKYVTSGTAPLSVATRDRFEERYGVPVLQAYGMSEVGAVSQERFDDAIAGRRGPGSVGRLADGVEVRIDRLDDDRPEGEGEILVRTDEATKEFIGGAPVPIDADGWFATGDVGRLDEGILFITGRVQEKIIVGGFNVYPAEVEDVARRSPLVDDIVVVGVPDERLGEHPVAGVVWAGAPDENGLLDELRVGLAAYKLPRSLFPLESVPLTAREKVDRRRAVELALVAIAQGSQR